MVHFDLVSSLALVTFALVVIGAIVLLMRFLRKPGNEHPMAGQRERNIDEIREESSAEQAPDRAIH